MTTKKTLLSLFLLIILMGAGFALQIEIDIPIPQVRVIKTSDGSAKFIGKNIQYITETGEPALPYFVAKALIPPGADIDSVTVAASAEDFEEIVGEWKVKPMPPLATWDGSRVVVEWPDDKTIRNGEDTDIYGSNNTFPPTTITRISTGRMRHWKLVDIPIALFQYIPVTGRLFRLTQLKIIIHFEKTPHTLSDVFPEEFYSDRIGEERIKRIALNYDDIVPEYHSLSEPVARIQDANRYVIITTAAIQASSSELGNFVSHIQSKGYTVQVVTESTWGGGTGDTAAENIRNWLQNNYLSLSIEYAQLIGNPNPSGGDVPMKMLWPRNNATVYTEYKEAPSDFYYADLTGDWDLDNDGKYGEWGHDFGSGGVDRNWDVLVGRIPYYGNISDLDSILSKIIAYGNSLNSEIGWRKKALLPMEPSDASTPGYHLGEQIKDDILIPEGDWSYNRVYDSTYSLSPPPETVPCTVNNVRDAWNGSQFGAIFWWTHGSDTYAADVMSLSAAAALDDTHPGFTFQCSCLNSYPEASNNLSYSLLKNGAIATVSATRVSWYYIGQTSFAGSSSNSGMTYEYSKRLITNGMTCGEALHDLKQVLIPSSDSIWMNFIDFNVYGNPLSALNDHITVHEVSTPDTPSGLSNGEINTSYEFTTGGSFCSQGHDTEYRFDWGDGTYSSWSSSTSAFHTWTTASTFTVRAQARCSVNTTIESAWSSGATLTIVTCILPPEPSNPTPSDGATGISRNTNLDWDDCEGAESYDVYFGTSSPPSFYANTTASFYDLPELNVQTHYYWKIVAKKTCGNTDSEEWDFTTGTTSGTSFFIPFGSLGNANINLGNIGTSPANVTVCIYDKNGNQVGSDSNFSVPSNGVALTWNEIGNIYDYGKPVTVEVESDQNLVADNIKWADDFIDGEDYDHLGAAMTCLPEDTMKGTLFYFTFSTLTWANAYCDISNTSDSTANVTIEVYNASGVLQRSESFTIPGKGVIRSWDYIGSIQAIANPALLKITSSQDVVVDTVRWEENKKGWGFAILPASVAGGTKFFIPFGSLGNANINLGNIGTSPANVTVCIYDKNGNQVGSDSNFSVPSNGVALTWNEIGNIYDYGKPVTVEVESDQNLVADNIKWADDFIDGEDYDHLGAAMTCLPEDTMKGTLFYFTFSTLTWANAYCDISNTSDSTANVTIEVYNASGVLQRSESFTIPGKGVIRSWDYIGSIQAIANPALLKITSSQDVVVDTVRWEENKKGWGFAIPPVIN